MENELASIRDAMRFLLNLMVEKKYHAIEELSGGNRLSALQIKDAISEYSHELVMPPDSEFESIDFIEIRNSEPKSWSVRFDLWAKGENKSDLSIECTLIESSNGVLGYDYEIDNIHVL